MRKFFNILLKGFVIWLVSVVTIILLITWFLSLNGSADLQEAELVVLNIKGTIGSASDIVGVEAISGENILSNLYKLRKSKKLKALVLRVNSGGGTLPGTQEIHLELKKLKKEFPELKIISSVSEIAASGAYYIITLSDIIYANPGSMIGNIGVISMFPNAEEFLKKIGIEVEIMKQGKYKDLGAWWRKMHNYEKESMERISEQAMEMFIKVVIEGRNEKIKKMKNFSSETETEEYIRSICNGEVFLGEQARENGLIDEVGNFYDAYDYAKKQTGIENPKVHVISEKGSMMSRLFGIWSLLKGVEVLNNSGKVMI